MACRQAAGRATRRRRRGGGSSGCHTTPGRAAAWLGNLRRQAAAVTVLLPLGALGRVQRHVPETVTARQLTPRGNGAARGDAITPLGSPPAVGVRVCGAPSSQWGGRPIEVVVRQSQQAVSLQTSQNRCTDRRNADPGRPDITRSLLRRALRPDPAGATSQHGSVRTTSSGRVAAGLMQSQCAQLC